MCVSDGPWSAILLTNRHSRPFTLEEINQLSVDQFKEKFINVVECWPEAGTFAAALLPFRNVDHLVFAFHHYLDQLPAESQCKCG